MSKIKNRFKAIFKASMAIRNIHRRISLILLNFLLFDAFGGNKSVGREFRRQLSNIKNYPKLLNKRLTLQISE